jgi:hypothetical protein
LPFYGHFRNYDNYFPEIEEKSLLFAEENQLEIDKNLQSDILETF